MFIVICVKRDDDSELKETIITAALYLQLRSKFSTIIKTIISFYEVEFSFDKNFLVANLNECRDLMKKLVRNHLTEKSVGKIDYVLDFFSNGAFLEEVFKSGSPYRSQMEVIIEDMGKALEQGEI